MTFVRLRFSRQKSIRWCFQLFLSCQNIFMTQRTSAFVWFGRRTQLLIMEMELLSLHGFRTSQTFVIVGSTFAFINEMTCEFRHFNNNIAVGTSCEDRTRFPIVKIEAVWCELVVRLATEYASCFLNNDRTGLNTYTSYSLLACIDQN